MARQNLELADIVREHGDEFIASRGGRLTAVERRVLTDIVSCRTAALGGHLSECNRCGHREISYNSCRNRHCPKCQAAARKKWLLEREAELLPVEYFHIVFSVPHEIASIAQQNKKVVYGILFRAASESLRELARDPKYLGAEIGFMAILHTWGQSLEHHPHVHCVIPGGGLSRDRSRWIPSRSGFFLPVKVLSRLFRGKFLAELKRAFGAGKLSFHGSLAPLAAASAFKRFLRPLYSKNWFVYSKPPFGGPKRVYRYLARYTHRVAISNRRLVALRTGSVSFKWKDYSDNCRSRVMTLSAIEFLRRFLIHILPKGFMRVRHFGFLANRNRKKNLAICRELLKSATPPESAAPENQPATEAAESDEALAPCPACKRGRLSIVLRFEVGARIPGIITAEAYDTS